MSIRNIWIGLILFMFSIQGIMSQATSDSLAWSIDLEEMVVTAQLKPTHYKNAIHKVEVIDRKQIEARAAVSMEEILSTASSIRLNQDPILGTQIQMRGMDAANVAILIDGVPVIGRLDGAVDISQLPTYAVERIEIVEGPMSNIYGSNAAGGVINIITRKEQQEGPSLQLRHQSESIGIHNTEGTLAFRQKKFWAQLSGRHFNFQQYPIDSMRIVDKVALEDSSTFFQTRYPWNPKRQYNASGKMGWNWGSQTDYSISVGGQWNWEEVKDYGPVRRPQFRPYAQDQTFTTMRKDLNASFLMSTKKGLQFEWTTAFNRFERLVDEKRFYLESQEFDSLLQQRDKTLLDNYFSRAHLTGQWGKRVNWGFGGTFNHEWGRGGRILDLNRMDTSSAVMTEVGIYNQWDIELLEDLELSASFRWNIHSEYAPQWTPSIQIKYQWAPKWTARASFAQGYRNPSLKERYIEFIDVNHFIIGGPNLGPERTNDFQTSIGYKDDHWEGSLGAFSTMVFDRIQLIEFESLKYRYGNIDSYRAYGVQWDLGWQSHSWELRSGLNWTFIEVSLNQEGGKVQRPVWDYNQQINFHEQYSDVRFSFNYRLQGNPPVFREVGSETVAQSLPAIHLMDFSAMRRFWKDRIELSAGLKNILNVTQLNIASSSGAAHQGGPARMVDQGRSLFISLGLQF